MNFAWCWIANTWAMHNATRVHCAFAQAGSNRQLGCSSWHSARRWPRSKRRNRCLKMARWSQRCRMKKVWHGLTRPYQALTCLIQSFYIILTDYKHISSMMKHFQPLLNHILPVSSRFLQELVLFAADRSRAPKATLLPQPILGWSLWRFAVENYPEDIDFQWFTH